MEFYKYHGTGNDFIIVENLKDTLDQWAKKMCHRHFGIGADGFMTLNESAFADIKMTYYNQDGSKAAMCGNGLRCFARHAYETGKVEKEAFEVETDAGLYRVDLSKGFDRIGIELTPDISYRNHCIGISNQVVKAYEINIGADHAVVFYEHDERDDLVHSKIAEAIRGFEGFERPVNVNFVRVVNAHEIEVTTFERGIGWTLSCGTGVIASQAVAHQLKKTHAHVKAVVPGGALYVTMGNTLVLEGAAVLIARGTWLTGGMEHV